mmetsp:Transcript_22488/g.63321  ORF Transcript_22488/g.63321 Transcript_22488/m.63321 type:complete len:204 (+) Transcript_22488:69-680(+)
MLQHAALCTWRKRRRRQTSSVAPSASLAQMSPLPAMPDERAEPWRRGGRRRSHDAGATPWRGASLANHPARSKNPSQKAAHRAPRPSITRRSAAAADAFRSSDAALGGDAPARGHREGVRASAVHLPPRSFGSPDQAKFVQYDDMKRPSWSSPSPVMPNSLLSFLLNTNGISQPWQAPKPSSTGARCQGLRKGASVGTRANSY